MPEEKTPPTTPQLDLDAMRAMQGHEATSVVKRGLWIAFWILAAFAGGFFMPGCHTSNSPDSPDSPPFPGVMYQPVTPDERASVSNMVVTILSAVTVLPDGWDAGDEVVRQRTAYDIAAKTLCPPRVYTRAWVLKEGEQ